MDKRKPISVRMNGKETSIKTNSNDDNPWSSSHREQAAAAADKDFNPDDLIEFEKASRTNDDPEDDWYQLKKTNKRSVPPMFKMFLLAAISAILVGVTLGFIMLRMFAGIDSNGVDQANTIQTMPPGNTNTNENGTVVSPPSSAGNESLTIESLNAFVIQAGVFSTQEKAEEWQQNYQAVGYPTMTWERDGQFHVFAGLSGTKDGTDESESLMIDQGLEPYSGKPWSTEEMTVEVASDEKEWIQGFAELWKDALTAPSSDSLGGSRQDWEQWLSNYPEQSSEQVAALYQSGQQFVESLSQEKESLQLQVDLLTLWKHYFNIGK
ncbi:hypothetical protein GH741_09770 [Aquibacillus halophilus]|uniref:SPOR domain-containing protein n=1 Tax=Aquibacillus halophilus TaxID=930132 RepID=A0A6A8DNZ6_9BACI|nr:hypothetical protein [Aquibacillus halophilus]MRH42972.1 hypothetical protein [Aquibacillus halophilus]